MLEFEPIEIYFVKKKKMALVWPILQKQKNKKIYIFIFF